MYGHYAYISEAGNYEFDFEETTTSKYFVVSAILIHNQDIENIQYNLENINFNEPAVSVGSSNMSRSALTHGVEWNLRMNRYASKQVRR